MLPLSSLSHAWTSTRDAVAKHLFLDRQADFWLGALDPLRSRTEVRARVVRIVEETPDTRTFTLEPSAAWQGHRAGQYTSVTVEVDGVRVRRCYSIASPPGSPLLAITVKRVPGGRVSAWLHERVRVGDIVGLGPATGDFVLPTPPPHRLLLLSGGSGVTPVMSILRDLADRDGIRDLVFVHYARSRADVVFGAELSAMALRHPGLTLHICLDDDPATPRGFDEAQLARLVPDFAERATFLCGPAPMMDRAERLWRGLDIADQLALERFTPAFAPGPPRSAAEGVEVSLTRSGRSVVARGPGSLLEQLERAGERPAHGCRIGICQTCRCTKRRGTVQNLLTGEISSEPDEEIQLCISAPHTDLELAI